MALRCSTFAKCNTLSLALWRLLWNELHAARQACERHVGHLHLLHRPALELEGPQVLHLDSSRGHRHTWQAEHLLLQLLRQAE
jgi:hypothetical protein